MVYGIERINARRRQPNSLINFITPLEGPDKAIAQDYLERLAAICYPIMRDNHLGINSLDEFPPNLEFWGRNFNGGECVQIVLKNPTTGGWLPFRFVQGVLIHELAHNKEMNHSRAFWAVRNTFAAELRKLHIKKYTGEGFWSAGRTLLSEELTADRPLAESEMPKSICGGTYHARTRTRRRRTESKGPNKKPKVTYAERQQRRVDKKFRSKAGEGTKIGADEEERQNLEDSKKSAPPSKIAGSKRARELRAAAALKRFEAQKKVEAKPETDRDEDATASDTDYFDDSTDDEETVNIGGKKFLADRDAKTENEEALEREEMKLLGGCATGNEIAPIDIKEGEPAASATTNKPSSTRRNEPSKPLFLHSGDTTDDGTDDEGSSIKPAASATELTKQQFGYGATADDVKSDDDLDKPSIPSHSPLPSSKQQVKTNPTTQPPHNTQPTTTSKNPLVCTVCSVTNSIDTVTCNTCGNLLTPNDPRSWSCQSGACPPNYTNSGDLVYCGMCGQKRNGG